MCIRPLASLVTLVLGCSMAADPGRDDSGGATPAGGSDASGDAPTTGGPGDGTDAEASAGTDAGACGDGQIGGDELCDGAELGGKRCTDLDAAFVGGELACAADCGSFDASGCELDPGAALVALNEVTSKGVSDGPYLGDAVELVNVGGAAADLSGWQLSDDPALPPEKTYVFPAGTSLAPGEFLVLVTVDDVTMVGDLPFGLSDSKDETLTLADPDGNTLDVISFAGADAVESYCRLPDGTGAWQACDPTFGASNAVASSVCGDGTLGEGEQCDGAELGGVDCVGLDLGFSGGTLACGETCTFDASMCTSGSALAINELESTDDQVELYNAGNQPLDLSGWILTDDLVDQAYDPDADPEKLVFPAQTSLAAKQFLVVDKGARPGQHPFGLGADGDTVTLLQPNLTVVDQVSYGQGEAALSYCRLPDGPGGAWTSGCTPTLGAANAGP
jgi:hypothetical protein